LSHNDVAQYNLEKMKPILDVEIRTLDDQSAAVRAVFDTGSFYTIVREDRVPSHASVVHRKVVRTFRGAAKGSVLTVVGEVSLVLSVGGRELDDVALVSPDLSQELIVGAGTMQKWDISLINKNGHTEVSVGRDMNDPDITEVD
jgi:hypothetical protein